MHYDPNSTDTIAAIATAAGSAGVGVIRVSGPLAPQIGQTLLGRRPKPRHAHYLRLLDAQGELLDHALLLLFPAPHSFTGEDVLELHAHGSPVQLQAILRRLRELGTRAARAGEFSERACLNDKLDLTQAEAVADLISARSELAARAALRSLEGEFSEAVAELLERLIQLRLHVEAAIDFPEEEIDFLADTQLQARMQAATRAHQTLLERARRGQRLRDGLHVVILGAPNAGKSSLLNALAGHDRAIVADLAGTTRDLLRESVLIDGIELTLVDTAGLREGGDAVEREGMRRARAEIPRADLALVVLAPDEAEACAAVRDAVADVPAVLWLHNKCDLASAPPEEALREDGRHLWISARFGTGLPRLLELIAQAGGRSEGADGSFSARARHVEALQQVGHHLEQASQRLRERAGELCAEELHQAQRALGQITGEFRSDDLLGRVFASFCIGK